LAVAVSQHYQDVVCVLCSLCSLAVATFHVCSFGQQSAYPNVIFSSSMRVRMMLSVRLNVLFRLAAQLYFLLSGSMEFCVKLLIEHDSCLGTRSLISSIPLRSDIISFRDPYIPKLFYVYLPRHFHQILRHSNKYLPGLFPSFICQAFLPSLISMSEYMYSE
jgi:hypothetical protein